MKILYYCQHVLGIGHFHRSLEICRACSRDHQVTMVIGGPEIALGAEPFSFFKLPGLQMDEAFTGLISCEPGRDLAQVKEERAKKLLGFFKDHRPDCLLVELYPFGRKAFRFELNPLLAAARKTPTRIFCSLRDILVEKKTDRSMWENRVVTTLNDYFDGLLVHADPQAVTLDSTFRPVDRLEVPIRYTGFITPRPRPEARTAIRAELGLGLGETLIVASIGSGSVGSQLLESVAAAAACGRLPDNFHFHLFPGPYCPPEAVNRLHGAARKKLVVEPFTDHFVDWLAAADLSVSMAGYNTSMNTLAAGVPALMLPFDQNREQRLRVEGLISGHAIRMLEETDLSPDRLAALMNEQLQEDHYHTSIDLEGARQTAQLLETL